MSGGYCNISLQRKNFSLQAEFEIPARGVLGIFGRSGSGKTTLLRCLAGLESEVKGEITLNDQHWLTRNSRAQTHRRKLGYVFQEGRLFPHMTVAKNLQYGLRRKQRQDSPTMLDHKYLLELLAIDHLLQRKPEHLSGGEKQRVAIARALLRGPDILLMDEPLASLDDERKQEIFPYLEKLHDELNIPILFVSHSLEEVSRLCDHMLIMEQGRVMFAGDIQAALTDVGSPLSHARNAVAMLESVVIKHDSDYMITTVQTTAGNRLLLQGALVIGQQTRLLIKAQDVSVCLHKPVDTSILNVIAGQVTRIEVDKNLTASLHIDCGGDYLLARITSLSLNRLELSPGQKVYVQIKAVSIKDA